jgi:large subunit ribosomal protein L19
MSAAIPCTRASAQRLAIRCKRFASTEALAVEPAELILPAKTSTWKPDLSQRLHRALYPGAYNENGEPKLEALRDPIRRKQTKKPIDARWQTVMRQKSVNRTLSMSTLAALTHIQPH